MGGGTAKKGNRIMNWSNISEFFSMGGYGLYVWGSYGVTLICVVGEILLIKNRHRTLEKQYGLTHDINKKETTHETTS